MKMLDFTNTSHNGNTTSQKETPQQANATKAMPTMFKDKKKVPQFFLSMRIYKKNLHNFLIDLGASCNVMPFSIAQKLGVTP